MFVLKTEYLKKWIFPIRMEKEKNAGIYKFIDIISYIIIGNWNAQNLNHNHLKKIIVALKFVYKL